VSAVFPSVASPPPRGGTVLDGDGLTMYLTPYPRYFSPYPLTDGEGEDVLGHGRTMDLFAGAVNRENVGGILWVCDRCFKYMIDGTSWEVHMVRFGFFPSPKA